MPTVTFGPSILRFRFFGPKVYSLCVRKSTGLSRTWAISHRIMLLPPMLAEGSSNAPYFSPLPLIPGLVYETPASSLDTPAHPGFRWHPFRRPPRPSSDTASPFRPWHAFTPCDLPPFQLQPQLPSPVSCPFAPANTWNHRGQTCARFVPL